MVDATMLRSQMVDRLKTAGILTSAATERALRLVPRHRFLRNVPIEASYNDRAVMVKWAPDGSAISSASQPTIVALMLEQLEIKPGHQILEVGTGTGYNAALLSFLVGDAGHVVTVELEPDLARQAAACLEAIGARRVVVLTGDGAAGHEPGAPFDRVIVTTGAQEIAPAWSDQLAEDGRMVVPLVDERGIGKIVVVDKVDGRLVRRVGIPCGFLPMRKAPAV